MTANVAFQDVAGKCVAVVEVNRYELGDQQKQMALQARLSELPQFQGFLVVLGVPHDGPLEAEFVAPQYIATALKMIGWIRLNFQPMELVFPNKPS